MGIKEEIREQESSPRSQHGATWVNHEPITPPRGSPPTIPVLTASAEVARYVQPASHQRTTSEFISAKRHAGAETPSQEFEEHQAHSSAPASSNTAHQAPTGTPNSADPYAHIRNQPRRERREPPIAPVPAYEAYEVVATPVFDTDDKANDEKKNPLKDWRIWIVILVVAALVGLSVGLVMMKKQTVAPAQSMAGLLPNDRSGDGMPAPEEPEEAAPSSAAPEEPEEPAPSPTEPSSPVDESASPSVEIETQDPEPTKEPPTPTEPELANCSKGGGPSVLLNEFSMSLVTVSSARDEVDIDVLITVVRVQLWEFLSGVTNVKGFSIKLDFPTGRMLRGLRYLLGATLKPRFTGCVDLFDDSAIPTYEEVQAAITGAFSGANLSTWLASAKAAGLDIASVAVFDAAKQQIGSA